MYLIQRTYGTKGLNFDYLMAWDEQYGTACCLNIHRALAFDTAGEAVAAAERANRECVKKADNMQFKVLSFA